MCVCVCVCVCECVRVCVCVCVFAQDEVYNPIQIVPGENLSTTGQFDF